MRLTRLLSILGFGIFCLVVSVQMGDAAVGRLGDGNGVNSHPHNLSNLSSSAVHAAVGETDQICIFCHTPHGASASASPLWNRKDPDGPVGGFLLYGGALGIKTIEAADYKTDSASGYPNGSTRMCMSCHDGVTAIGTVLNGGDIAPSLTSMTANGTVDLSTSHPVSFVYTQPVRDALGGTFLSAPAGWLDSSNRMQCTTCHDPHVDTRDGTYNLPMWANYTGELNSDSDYKSTCNACHGATYNPEFPGDLGNGHTGNF